MASSEQRSIPSESSREVGTESEEEEQDESPRPPEVDETDVDLMALHSVHGPERDVEATITSDGDSLTVTGTDLRDITASIISSRANAGSFVFHSAMSSTRMHTNTRFAITGTRNEFALRRYGKPCRAAALTLFRNLELFRVSNGAISFIVTVYILDETIPKYPCFLDKWVTILCCAFNVARMSPSLCLSYQRLSKRKKGEYDDTVAAMLPFECRKGTKDEKSEISDTVTDMPHEIGLAFIRVFWEVIEAWADLSDELEDHEKDTEILKYDLDVMMKGTVREAFLLLDEIPTFARYLKAQSIFSARSVGIKSAWPNKPCSLVFMNDKEKMMAIFLSHTALIQVQGREFLTYVPHPYAKILVGIDVAHQLAPVEDFTSFVCQGFGMARFAKVATQRTKASETAWREDHTSSTTGESAIAVPVLFPSFAKIISHCFVSICMCI
jgi:hypothetical protein